MNRSCAAVNRIVPSTERGSSAASVPKKIHKILAGLLLCFAGGQTSALNVTAVEQSVVRVFSEGGMGTGTVINRHGYVLTNYHVIGGHRKAVVASGFLSQAVRAQVVWMSQEMDLAILKAENLPLPPLALAASTPQKGVRVFAMGFPGASDYNINNPEQLTLDATLTDGVLSRVFNDPWAGQSRALQIVQHTAPINPGNSGGPLLDECGRVLGVNTQTDANAQGIYWASHIQETTAMLQQLHIEFELDDNRCPAAGEPARQTRGSTDMHKKTVEAVRFADRAAVAAHKAGQTAQTASETAQSANQAAKQAGAQALSAIKEVTQVKRSAEQAGQLAQQALQDVAGTGRQLQQLYAQLQRYQIALFALAGLTVLTLLFSLRRSRVAHTPRIEPAMNMTAIAEISGKTRDLVLEGIDNNAVQLHIAEEDLRSGMGFSLGRTPAVADFPIDHAGLSHRHARLRMLEHRWLLEDLNSEQGTQLNGVALKPFESVEIHVGDRVALGDLMFKVDKPMRNNEAA